MKLFLKILLSFLVIVSSFSNPNEIGKITKLRGEVSAQRANDTIKLGLDEFIELNDLVKTEKKSFLKIEFIDKTTIVIGPNSELKIQKFTLEKGSVFNLMRGQFRTKVNKRVTKVNSVIVKTNLASLGIRGTEFLTNSYSVNGKSVTDTALLKGSIETTIKDSPSFMLNQSEAFNTNQLSLNQGVTKLSPESVESLINNSESFLPNIQNVDGSFNNINDLIKKRFSLNSPKLDSSLPSSNIGTMVGMAAGLGIGVAAIAANNDDDEDMGSKKDFPEKIKVSQELTKKTPEKKELDLAKLPWSIRDALLRRDDLLEANECFYWFFKRIPGGGEKELFRRERDCNEFDNDL